MKYKIISQSSVEERDFTVKDEKGETFTLDFYTDGNIEIPPYALETGEAFGEWLKSFVGKEIEIERIIPYKYFSYGRVKLLK